MRMKPLIPNNQTPINETQKITDEQLQNEFNFYQAEHLLMQLIKNELITQAEFDKISELNRQKFNPLLGPLMCDKP